MADITSNSMDKMGKGVDISSQVLPQILASTSLEAIMLLPK